MTLGLLSAAAGPASAQCTYRMNDVGRFHGYLSGPCNGAASGLAGAYPAHPNAAVGANPTVRAPQVNGHASACESTCQSKCQATWRAGGFPNVEACYAKWSRLNANPELARECESANRARGWRRGPGCWGVWALDASDTGVLRGRDASA